MKETTKELFRRNQLVVQKLGLMPQLWHWPDRNKPFDYRSSSVIAWIVGQGASFEDAIRIFHAAGAMGKKAPIRFNRETRQWSGVFILGLRGADSNRSEDLLKGSGYELPRSLSHSESSKDHTPRAAI